MTFGTEIPDINDDQSLEIRPANAAALGMDAPKQTAPVDTGDSALDLLLSFGKTELENIKAFPVTSRPGNFVLEFDCIVPESAIKRYRAAAIGKKKKAEDADQSKGNAMILAERNIGIYHETDGKRRQILDSDGDPLLLNSDQFLAAYGRGTTAELAIRKFLGDAETNSMGAAVLKAGGWGEDLEPLDPTDA